LAVLVLLGTMSDADVAVAAGEPVTEDDVRKAREEAKIPPFTPPVKDEEKPKAEPPKPSDDPIGFLEGRLAEALAERDQARRLLSEARVEIERLEGRVRARQPEPAGAPKRIRLLVAIEIPTGRENRGRKILG
jgi:hypothetical protein